MTLKEAEKIVRSFDENNNPSEDEVFLFTEALKFLIDEKHDPEDMMCLGGYYYEIRRFDLALKYYEMAAEYGYDQAYECLGYIWYYGRTGKVDHKKAYEYFSKLMDKGKPVAAYKVADMYKNGYYVEKNQKKYEEIIEELYPKTEDMYNAFDLVPEILTRLAGIRKEQGDIENAIELYQDAKYFLARRIELNPFFGNLNIMKWLITDLYQLKEFDHENFDLYDLYYLLNENCRVSFYYGDEELEIQSEMANGKGIAFAGKWFLDIDSFFRDASINDYKLTGVASRLFGFKIKEAI